MVDKIAEFVAANKLPIAYKQKNGIITITPLGLDISEIDEICMKFNGKLINGEIVIYEEGR
jgi:hypothetical protein